MARLLLWDKVGAHYVSREKDIGLRRSKQTMRKMVEYANKIRKIQSELGISVAAFPNLGIT
jgi:hypothetical protein